MLNIHRRYRPSLYLKALTFLPNPNPLFPSLLTFSLHFCTNTSDSTSFAASYLIHNFGFTPQFPSKLCSAHRLRFKTTQKPESVLTFFRNYGFSDSQLRHMIPKMPWLLSCDPSKKVLPKFQFFLSKGASNSDIVSIVTKTPRVLSPSLNNHIVPTYELLYRFLQSHKDTIAVLSYNTPLLCDHLVPHNIKILVKNGVTDANIARLLWHWGKIFKTRCILKLMEELKDLGFNPSKTSFVIALLAKTSVNKTLWKEKVHAFKNWGWSDEDVLQAFRKAPQCLLTSIDKINLLMRFWVNQLGWDALALTIKPKLFGASLERRIIPRASIVQYLLKKGLRKKNASLTTPFLMTDKLFIDTYIIRYKEESSYLLNLYEEKLNLGHTRD